MSMMDNFGNPKGLMGKFMLKGMNAGHKYIMKYAINLFDWQEGLNILDVGCGGGISIQLLLNASLNSRVTGLDISKEAVDQSKKLNKKYLGDRCNVLQGSVEKLLFDNNTFDTVTAFETIFFWPNIRDCFKEVYRVTKLNGRFIIAFDAGDPNKHWDEMIPGMKTYTPEELKEFYLIAGFRHIEIHKEKNTYCLCGYKK